MTQEEILERIRKLEEWAHPPKDLREFNDYKDLDERLKKLEEMRHGNND
jgi:hypothetical protein